VVSVDCRGRRDPQTGAISNAGPELANCPDTLLRAVACETGPDTCRCAILLPVVFYVTILESVAYTFQKCPPREILFPMRHAITLEPSASAGDLRSLGDWTWYWRSRTP
jgi:hypothetical protein